MCNYSSSQTRGRSCANLQTAAQETRQHVIPVNSPVRESESNGRVEVAIRRAQEVRAWRHQLECGIQRSLPDDAPIMSWSIRWTGAFTSKYVIGDDGKSTYERVRGEQCAVPIVPFAEAAMYIPLGTARHTKGEAVRRMGAWLGTIERIQETSSGTTTGVTKCRTVNRFSKDERWNRRLVLDMQAAPWEAVSGKQSQHIPVEIGQDRQTMGEAQENMLPKKEDAVENKQELEYSNKTHNRHSSRKAISKFGTIEGRPACNATNKRGYITGRIGHNHSTTCREMIEAEMQDDLEYRGFMHRHEFNQEAGDVAMLTESQIKERRHNALKAIHVTEKNLQKVAGNVGQQFTQTMFNHLIAKMEAAEAHSPSRVVGMARRPGLRAGWALGITTKVDDGR